MAGSGWLWVSRSGQVEGISEPPEPRGISSVRLPLIYTIPLLQLAQRDSKLVVLPTYGAGTLLVRHGNLSGRSSDTPLYRPLSSLSPSESDQPVQLPSSVSSSTQSEAKIKPLACVSLFEHVYMPSRRYGVIGREQYVRDWFRSLDWRQVESEGGFADRGSS